jgi:hypothetical protein
MTDATVEQLVKPKGTNPTVIDDAEFYLMWSKTLIDDQFGDGFAYHNPEFFGEMMLLYQKTSGSWSGQLGKAIKTIDQQMGKGYSAEHPAVVSAFLKMASKLLRDRNRCGDHD